MWLLVQLTLTYVQVGVTAVVGMAAPRPRAFDALSTSIGTMLGSAMVYIHATILIAVKAYSVNQRCGYNTPESARITLTRMLIGVLDIILLFCN